MKKYIEYINKFQEWNKYWIYFIENNLGDWTYKDKGNMKTLTQTEIEHILDFLFSEKKIYKSIWLKTILEKTNSWNKKLIEKSSSKDNEIQWEDYEVVKDFGDWYKFVKLLSKQSYEREWKLMSSCVSSYYWLDRDIYSLRDKKNLPHCTIEENNQVKWKWNQSVHNQYFWYCIKFLEEQGMSMWENEMKNIWFHKLSLIDKDLVVEDKYLWDWKYISDKNLNKIKDKDWNQYNWFWLLKVKNLLNFKLDWSFEINLSIKDLIDYSINRIKSDANEDYSTSYTSRNYSTSAISGHRTTTATSWTYSTAAASGDNSTSITIGEYSTAVTDGWNSTAAASGDYCTAATSWYESTSVTDGQNSTAAASGWGSTSATSEQNSTAAASGNYSKVTTSGNRSVTAASGNHSKVTTSGVGSVAVTSGYNSRAIANGKNNIAVANWKWVKAKWKIGNYLVLTEYKDWDIINCKLTMIDWKEIKEDTYYVLLNWEFKEAI